MWRLCLSRLAKHFVTPQARPVSDASCESASDDGEKTFPLTQMWIFKVMALTHAMKGQWMQHALKQQSEVQMMGIHDENSEFFFY